MEPLKLKLALLCDSVDEDPLGIRSIHNITTGMELALPVSRSFRLPFWFSATPNSTFKVATEVRGVFNEPLWFDSGTIGVGAGPDGEFAPGLGPITLAEVGPYRFSLAFDGTEVWFWKVFIARKL